MKIDDNGEGGESRGIPSRWDAAFAADLHLQAHDSAGLKRAIRLLQICTERTEHLYLLGDVFDVWTSAALLRLEEFQDLYDAFRQASAAGLKIWFLPGNRDFNLTPSVGEKLGMRVCAETLAIENHGRRFFLSHGDAFLLRDVGYQRLKRVIRSAPMRFLARHLPSSLAMSFARRLRRYSDRVVPAKTPRHLAIVPEAVESRFDEGFDVAICGHVHRAERVSYGAGRELLVLPAFLEEARFAYLEHDHVGLFDMSGVRSDFPAASVDEAVTHGASPADLTDGGAGPSAIRS